MKERWRGMTVTIVGDSPLIVRPYWTTYYRRMLFGMTARPVSMKTLSDYERNFMLKWLKTPNEFNRKES